MKYTLYDYTIFFFLYSFLGWVLEEVIAAFKYGRFINRGFLNGPLCPLYGLSMVVVVANLKDLTGFPLFQFMWAVIIITVMQYITGMIMLRITGKRPWDYSDKKANLNGYVCLQYSAFWGLCAVIGFWLVHPLFYIIIQLMLLSLKNVILIVSIILFLCDISVTVTVVLGWNRKNNVSTDVAQQLLKARNKIGKNIFLKIQSRMYKAFPELAKEEPSDTDGFGKVKERIFANGLCLDKLIWIFLVSGFLGDWIETLFMWVTTGRLISRSSLLYGTFSIVWGLGGAIATELLYSFRNKSGMYTFIGGFFLGGVYEYTCSVFTEVALGTTFWDYSGMPFNLNGRVNLLFCFLWGILAIAWIKLLYPTVSGPIEKIPVVAGKIFTGLIVALIVMDMVVSGLAINRYVQRNAGAKSNNGIEKFMDYTYPNEFIEKVYPNMKIK
jgi:uncharacterized membrane protein